MRSVNHVVLMGHLAADPEIRETQNGTLVAEFPIATDRTVMDDDGKKKDIADYHRVIVWDGLAKITEKFLVKGMAVYLDGRIVNRSFDDKDGNRHYRTEIVADRLNIITWKKKASGKEEVGIEEVADEKKIEEREEELVAA
jgi:single-strand DNA-binding protein